MNAATVIGPRSWIQAFKSAIYNLATDGFNPVARAFQARVQAALKGPPYGLARAFSVSYCFRTVTNTSLSPRQTRIRAIRPAATFCNSRPASEALEIC